ncbi:glycosyl transferase (plasmid) [Paracoccus sp. TK19116]|uniref:Glycosyl transferase n=1 Tax=Paracoccus albicereus TaxID=2922394 RepID=A0ABT1MLV7_9RHOB|nr:glycosyl transferase [Paracoccus albicereus]MCQ0969161.1 glycosyl transferase [Paracoccus albicereus]
MIAVVGSGPSLRIQRIEALGDRTAILCNGAASLSDRIRPLAVAVEDERFVFRHQLMLAALDASIPLLLSPAAIRAWAEVDTASLRGRTVALIENLAKPVNASRRSLSEVQTDVASDGSTFLSRDPDAGVVITGTVAFSALQFALAARPGKILLAGIDLSNDAQPRFYETGDSAPSGLSAGLTRILAGFALAYREAQKQGTELTCASPVSALLPLGIPYDDTLTSS